jgi:hypothetical protein
VYITLKCDVMIKKRTTRKIAAGQFWKIPSERCLRYPVHRVGRSCPERLQSRRRVKQRQELRRLVLWAEITVTGSVL